MSTANLPVTSDFFSAQEMERIDYLSLISGKVTPKELHTHLMQGKETKQEREEVNAYLARIVLKDL